MKSYVIFPDHIRNTGTGIDHQRFCSQRFPQEQL